MPRTPDQCPNCTVSVDDVAGKIGYTPAMVHQKARHLGVELVEDWAGQPAMPVETASRFVGSVLAENEALSAKNFAYGKYLDAQRDKVVEDRIAGAARAREELAKRRLQSKASYMKEVEHQRGLEQARRDSEDWGEDARHRPVDFDKFRDQ